MTQYTAALIGCSRMGAFIDNEVPARMRPYSHAAGYEACERVDLIACSDVRKDVMARVGERYGIPAEKQYVDYQQMLEREKPDIVSVATQPEQRAAIVVWAAENGTRADLCGEGPVSIIGRGGPGCRGVRGQRRHSQPGNQSALGSRLRCDKDDHRFRPHRWPQEPSSTTALAPCSMAPVTVSTRCNDSTATHRPSQCRLSCSTVPMPSKETFCVRTRSVMASSSSRTASPLMRWSRAEVTKSRRSVKAASPRPSINGNDWQLRIASEKDYRGRDVLAPATFPDFDAKSSTLVLVEDLVQALDSGEPPRGGVRVARANMELIFAFVESHMRGGLKVDLPLTASSYRLDRQRQPAQPRYEPIAG